MANVYREGMDKSLLVIEKDYEKVCAEWLGLKPAKKRALIERQLGKRLAALKECRLLRECRIVERVNGKGFRIVAYASSGFFADYENIYCRKAPQVEVPKTEQEPLLYLAEFHRQLSHTIKELTPKEIAYVRDLLKRYGDEGVRNLMAYGLREAQATHFPMQWFGALSIYEAK